MYHDCTAQVRAAGSRSPPFPTQVGVKQGCPSSPVLFSLFIDRVVEYLCDNAPLHLRTSTPLLAGLATFVLLYADDLVLLAYGARQLQLLLDCLGTFCDENGMKVSVGSKGKSEVLLAGTAKEADPPPVFCCQGTRLPLTDNYRYLGQDIRVAPDLLQ